MSKTLSELGGLCLTAVRLHDGQDIMLPAFLVSRYPRAFSNLRVIDIARRPRYAICDIRHQICLGIRLAKREMRTMMECFLSQMNKVDIPDVEKFEYHKTGMIGVYRLILAWDPV